MSSDALLAENSQLRTENDSLRANLEAVQFQLEQLKRLVFGHRSEKLVMGDAGSGFLFPITSPPEPAAARPAKDEEPKPPRQKPKRTALPAALPREVEVAGRSEGLSGMRLRA